MTTPARLQSWLNRVPPNAAGLVLVWESLSDVPVCSWTLAEVVELGASSILQVAQDHCDDREKSGSYATVWITADNPKGVARKSFKVAPSDDDDDETIGEMVRTGNVRTEDATPEGQVAQAMRHSEIDRRITNAANAAAFGALQQVIKELRSELALAREENRQLRAENKRLRSAQDENEVGDAEALARADVWQSVSTAIQQAGPAIATKLAEATINQVAKPNGKGKRPQEAEQ